MRTVGYAGEVPCYLLQIMDSKKGEYLVTLTVESFLEDTTQEMLDMFYPVEQ